MEQEIANKLVQLMNQASQIYPNLSWTKGQGFGNECMLVSADLIPAGMDNQDVIDEYTDSIPDQLFDDYSEVELWRKNGYTIEGWVERNISFSLFSENGEPDLELGQRVLDLLPNIP